MVRCYCWVLFSEFEKSVIITGLCILLVLLSLGCGLLIPIAFGTDSPEYRADFKARSGQKTSDDSPPISSWKNVWNEYDFLVAVTLQGRVFLCLGTLVSEHFVLSSAQCVIGQLPKMNTQLVLQIVGTETVQTRAVRYTVYHTQYDAKRLVYDVAIHAADKPFHMDANVRTVHLASRTPNLLDNSNNEAISIGWESEDSGVGMGSVRTMKMRMIDVFTCTNNSKLQTTYFDSTKLCATVTNNTSVTDDHQVLGGPLLMDNQQIGIASTMSNTKISSPHLQFFTSVPHVYSWIQKHCEILINASDASSLTDGIYKFYDSPTR